MPSKMMTPRDLVKGHPATPDGYVEIAARRAQAVGRVLVTHAQPLVAYVNRGRWVADCHHCGAGIAIDPDSQSAPCLECFRVYTAIDIPLNRHAIEEALAVRPVKHQHWGYLRGVARNANVPGESLADLARDEGERRGPADHLRVRI